MWKYPGSGGTIREFYQTGRKECFKTFINTNSTYSVETKEDGTFSTHCIQPSITLITSPEKNTHTQKENYEPISLMNLDTIILNEILAK